MRWPEGNDAWREAARDHWRRFCHAGQFLTRLPTPPIRDFRQDDLSRSAIWFPAVGLIIGVLLAIAVWLGGQLSPWLGGLFGLILWVWVTGALHLDGLGDVADGLGAAHRAPQRFLEVLRDPHIGAFGVIAIVVQLMAKLVLLGLLAGPEFLPALLLVPAWARWGPLIWSLMVPPLAGGTGERFSWSIDWPTVATEGVVLGILSLWLAPSLLLAFIIVPAISFYWLNRIGGITGDCLGASVEVTESLLLLVLFVAIATRPALGGRFTRIEDGDGRSVFGYLQRLGRIVAGGQKLRQEMRVRSGGRTLIRRGDIR
ncbi:Cobalamin synthase [Methyloligella halotolerans]|uniref:Adenosylcobinamide-GDP ribazoletransferase n=1 Tax=Methyloligella halotolerans TaxID=1177755 RepID=A0A1E2S1A4_9HYPH|nr:Cobalamin synthase [Methyloligella halotolerans]